MLSRVRVNHYCLKSGRARGVNTAFRETRMATRASLVLNELGGLTPHTK